LKTTEDKISYEKYYKFIDSSEHKYVYLATDDIIIKEKFIKRYGDKIFCYDSFCDNIQLGHNVRNTYPISIYVDMFMCRGAYSFLGTHKSTFSEFIHILKIFM
jgi:hypothetical protein